MSSGIDTKHGKLLAEMVVSLVVMECPTREARPIQVTRSSTRLFKLK